MKFRNKILFSVIYIIGIFILFFPNNVISAYNDDIEYTFNKNTPYSDINNLTSYNYNLRNETINTEYYNATYDFNNDIIGSEPSEWISNNNVNCTTLIKNEIDNHQKVLELYDNNNSGQCDIYNSFSYQINSQIEFWWGKSDLSNNVILFMYEDAVRLGYIYLTNDDLQYYDGSTHNIKTNFLIANELIHIKIIINDTFNMYNVYVNDILEGSNLNFQYSSTLGINKLKFTTNNANTNFSGYIDAIGYSWNSTHSATYSFENDVNGGYPLGFTVNEITDGDIQVVSEYLNHKKIVKIIGNDGGDNRFSQIFSQEIGIIEMWIKYIDLGVDDFYITIYGSLTNKVDLHIEGGIVYAYDGAIKTSIIDPVSVDWFHLRFDIFVNTFDIYIDGVLEANGFNITNDLNPNEFVNIEFRALNWGDECIVYIDAIGYSWDTNYYIGKNIIPIGYFIDDNIQPYLETTNNLIPDRYEFAFDSNGNTWQDNIQNPSLIGWNNTGTTSYLKTDNNDVSALSDSNYGLKFQTFAPLDTGIEKDYIKLDNDNINITFGIRYLTPSLTSEIFLYIYSLDDTEVIRLRIVIDGSNINKSLLYYYNGATYTLLESIYGSSSENNLFEFNLFILFYNVSISWFKNGILNNSYSFPLLQQKSGLNKISFIVEPSGAFTPRLDYFGIYQYNNSISNEFGYISYDLETTWNMRNQNLFTFTNNANNNIKIKSCSEIFLYYTVNNKQTLKSYNNNSLFFNNYYNKSVPYLITTPYLMIITDIFLNYSYYSFIIEGVKLNQDINEYYPSYTFNNVNGNYSYFYVQNNRLYHSLNITQDYVFESMIINFDIINIITVNRSINFQEVYNGFGNAFAQVKYADGLNNTFDYKTNIHSYNFILPQKQMIDNFTFIIDDNNQSSFTNNYNNGWIKDITLIWFPDIEYTILVLDLLFSLIPLIVMLVPSISIRQVFGKKFFFPIMIFMTILLFAIQFIPLWQFSILLLIYGYLLMNNRSEFDG